MNENELMQQLRDMRYPATVNVVEGVMEQVRNKPLLVPREQSYMRLRRVATAVAASLILAFGINVTLLFTHDYNEAQIGNMIVDIYNFHANYGNSADASFSFGAIETLY